MRRRHAFTLVEMLVAMALILLIMSILSEAFVYGMDAFHQLKAMGDMDQRLRSCLVLLSRDLADDHFDSPPLKLSSLQIDVPPAQGFFAVYQGSPSITEGTDANGIASLRATNHGLHFTVNRGYNVTNDPSIKYNRRENYFVAGAGNAGGFPAYSMFNDGQNYLSHYAEVAYFLVPNGQKTPGGTVLYELRRRQLIIPTPADLAAATAAGVATTGSDISASSAGQCNTMATIGQIASRALLTNVGSYAPGANGTPFLTMANMQDLLVTDVISFVVQVYPSNGTGFVDLATPPVYDTGSASATTPLPYNILGLQIILRVWDVKTGQSRQVTLVQDM